MRRDMDAIRQIVLVLAESDDLITGVDGMDKTVFAFNAELLIEAGLAHGNASNEIARSQARSSVHLRRLTWAGQEFASAITDDTLWRKAKDTVIKPSASFTFDLLKEWLKAEISQGLPTLRGLGQ